MHDILDDKHKYRCSACGAIHRVVIMQEGDAAIITSIQKWGGTTDCCGPGILNYMIFNEMGTWRIIASTQNKTNVLERFKPGSIEELLYD